MRSIKMITVLIFALLILIPIFLFNFEENVVSEIDNRMLAENPFTVEGDLTDNFENYVNDRIGLRSDMIQAYTMLNDKLFGEMVHPSYGYGKDGYIFGAGLSSTPYDEEYFGAFVDMVKMIQNYCEERDVPFLFVFEPAKPAVYQEYIAKGINYSRDWVDRFFAALDEQGIRYLDNTVTLRQKKEEGLAVFNQKYDPNHWNDLGAFYGVTAMLNEFLEDYPNLDVCQEDDLRISQEHQTTMVNSDIPIDEYVPRIQFDMQVENLYDEYIDEIELDPSFQGFGYYVNEAQKAKGAPRVLAFEGSYMLTKGHKYLSYSMSEHICVHDYQNVINFAYYYNIFQPDCVIFEVAEYTLNETYFSYQKMCNMDLNPTLESVRAEGLAVQTDSLNTGNVTVDTGETLTKIRWNTEDVYEYVWIELDQEYDMIPCEGGYEVTIHTDVYEQNTQQLAITALQNGQLSVFQ